MGKAAKGRKGRSEKQRIVFILIPLAVAAVVLLIWVSRPWTPQKEIGRPVLPLPQKKEEKKEEAKEAEKKVEEKEAKEAPPPEAAPPPSLPKLAIIIDDVGYNKARLKQMMGMGRPITFAILPHTPHGREGAVMAHENGSEVMLHLPMEPKESERYNLEKHTLCVGMPASVIQQILKDDFRNVPFVRGVNNHMGSKATEDAGVMQALMEVLKQEKLYYIDSFTSSHTVGPKMAQRYGVRYGKNTIFLDREKNLLAIKTAIQRAMHKAKKRGKAVAIGHANPLTGQAIREMIPEIEREGIQLVFASKVVG